MDNVGLFICSLSFKLLRSGNFSLDKRDPCSAPACELAVLYMPPHFIAFILAVHIPLLLRSMSLRHAPNFISQCLLLHGPG